MHRRRLLTLAAATTFAPLGRAETKPTIRLVVAFPPGGATDIVARSVSQLLAQALQQNIVVDNRPGAGGSIGMAEVARARPDGLTLGLATVSTHGVNPAVYKKLPYDAIAGFAPVSELVKAPGVLVVSPAAGAGDFASFVQLLKSRPGQLSYASAGNGTVSHLWGELFKSGTRTDMLHVPYRGAAPAVTDLLAGQVHAYFDQLASSLPHIRSGKLKALAVTWPQRLKLLPEVPTFAEVSLPGSNVPSWFGLVAPAGTPAAAIESLHGALVKVLKDPGLADTLEAQALYPAIGSPQAFGQQIREEIARMRQVASAARIELD